MKNLYALACTLLTCGSLLAQVQDVETFNTTFRGQVTYDVGVNDIWGYAAPDGTEYALVGLSNALSIVSLADPDNPVEIQRIPGINTVWRDIKTMNDHAYVVADGVDQGLLIVDLTTLPDTGAYRYMTLPHPPSSSTFRRAHNIFIDTTSGYAYLAGSNLNNGGQVVYDVGSQPDTAIFVANMPPTYAHDVFVQDNRMYASEIYEGLLSIYDVSDIQNVSLIGATPTPSDFTHNAWTTADANYVFTCDERADAPVAAYDITDPTSPVLLDEFRPARSLGLGTIPHNVHVLDEYLVTSYYSDGLSIADASVPENIIEVGYFDSWPINEQGFNGNWGAYPFLPSGLVLMTDRTYGLHVVEVDYKRGARLHGNITDATTGEMLNNVSVSLTGPDEQNTLTDADGDYLTGSSFGGDYTVTLTRFGYDDLVVPVTLENGVVTILDTALVSTAVGTTEFLGDPALAVDIFPNPTQDAFQLRFDVPTGRPLQLQLFNTTGQLVLQQDARQNQTFGQELRPGLYYLQLTTAGQVVYATKLVKQ